MRSPLTLPETLVPGKECQGLLQDDPKYWQPGMGKPPGYGYPELLPGLPIKGISSLESGKQQDTGQLVNGVLVSLSE